MTVKSVPVYWQLAGHDNINISSAVTWDSDAPLEIRLLIQTGTLKAEVVEWRFARDLLLDGIQRSQAGEADVKVHVKDDTLTLHLESPFGEVSLLTEASYIGQFLASTLLIVPRGAEECGVDEAIAKILEDTV